MHIDPAQLSTLVNSLISLAVIVITVVLIPAIKAWAAAQNASKLSQEQALRTNCKYEIEDLVRDSVKKVSRTCLPQIAEWITLHKEENIGSSDVRAQLGTLAGRVMDEVYAYAQTHNIDVEHIFGGKENVKAIIDAEAESSSPFPGQKTSVALLDPTNRQAIADKGVDAVRMLNRPKSDL